MSDGHAFRPLLNPATGETYRFLARARPEEQFRMSWSLARAGSVPEHVHPNAEERFEITSGRVRFWLADDELVRGPGERLVIPAGTAHRFVHDSGAVEGYVELEPALRMPEFFEAVSGLSRAGRSTRRGVPRNPLQAAAFAAGFWPEFQMTHPPRALQRLVLPPVAAVARRLGYREHDPSYDSIGGTI